MTEPTVSVEYPWPTGNKTGESVVKKPQTVLRFNLDRLVEKIIILIRIRLDRIVDQICDYTTLC